VSSFRYSASASNSHPNHIQSRAALDAAIESGAATEEDGIEEAFELVAEVGARSGGPLIW
jgi:hypothetical protein